MIGQLRTRLRKVYRLAWSIQKPKRQKELEQFWARYLGEPAPLTTCLKFDRTLSRVFDSPNPLSPPPVKKMGKEISDPEVAERLGDEEFGGWSPEVKQIDWLVDTLKRERPRTVLEFGGGRSTVAFCIILNRLHGPKGFRMLSIDQDLENVERATERLAGLPGQANCRIVHAPLKEVTVADRRTVAYDIDRVDTANFSWLGKAEFVFVDGPFGDGPCRYGTLTQTRQHISRGARFVMDDALRKKELIVGSLWAKEKVLIDGVLTLGQGMMVGVLP